MKPNLILCLALVLSGSLFGFSNARKTAALFPTVENRLPAFIDQTGRAVKQGQQVIGFNVWKEPEVLFDRSRNYQAEETERVENNREILRLATLINPTNPPVTGQMLESGEFDGGLQLPGSEFVCFQNTTPENAQPILVRLLKYSLPAERRKSPFGLWPKC